MPDPLLKELERHSPATPEPPKPYGLDALDLALVVSARRKGYAKFFFAVMIVATIIVFLLPLHYTATAKLLPPQNSQSGLQNMFLSQLSGGSGGAGALLGSALNVKNSSDVYVAMLKSRTLEDKIIKDFDLFKVYGVKNYVAARKELEDDFDVRTGKDGVIILEYEAKNPTRARDITKAFVDNVLQLSEDLAISEAGQRRKYFDRELKSEKDRLADAEIELKKVQQSSGLIIPNEQARAIVEATARIQAQIAAKEVQIGAMRNFAAPQNPELVQAEKELAGLQAQLQKLQKNQTTTSDGNILVPTGNIPESSMEFIRKYRDFKYHETLYEMLAKQFELARLDESRDYASLQVLDWPVVPDQKSGPHRAIILALCAIALVFFIFLHAALSELHRLHLRNPDYAARVARLQSLWRRA